jgi:hypothetical protein
MKNGGTAFPVYTGNSEHWEMGMTLRDYFAGQALIGLCSSEVSNPWGIGFDPSERSYEIADRMLEERAK